MISLRIFSTPVKVKAPVLLPLIALWGGVTWLGFYWHPERDFWHGLLLIMSLLPLPIVDGGTLVKWTLVARGRTETEADEMMRRVDWVMGIMVRLIGVGIISLRIWIVGVILAGMGVVLIAIAAGKIR